MRWTKRALFIAAALLFVPFALACDDEGNAEPDTPQPTQVVVVETATPASGPPIPFDEPPGTTASSGGETVEMGIGTYCWTALCVDKIGPITRETLQIASGDEVVVAIPDSAPPLREVSVIAFPASEPQQLEDGETAWRPDFDNGVTLEPRRDGDEVRIEATLEPGTYVLNVGMFFEPGDVQYGVVLEVE